MCIPTCSPTYLPDVSTWLVDSTRRLDLVTRLFDPTVYMDTALSSTQQAAFFSLTSLYHWFWSWRLILLPLHWNLDRSLDTALICYVQQAGCLPLPSLNHWLIFILSKWCPTISVSPFGLVIFEDKGHIGEVIAAMLINTNPPLIPGIHHFFSGIELLLQPWSD